MREEKFLQSFGRETEGKRLYATARSRWKNHISMDLKEIKWEVVD
jgi:hypothetical protein